MVMMSESGNGNDEDITYKSDNIYPNSFVKSKFNSSIIGGFSSDGGDMNDVSKNSERVNSYSKLQNRNRSLVSSVLSNITSYYFANKQGDLKDIQKTMEKLIIEQCNVSENNKKFLGDIDNTF